MYYTFFLIAMAKSLIATINLSCKQLMYRRLLFDLLHPVHLNIHYQYISNKSIQNDGEHCLFYSAYIYK